jgi:hypothetical protein
MRRPLIQNLIIASVALFLGVAGTAAVLAYVPDTGSTPSVYDDFNWNSIGNGYWHVNAIGSSALIKGGLLTLTGHSVELDKRIQTDPRVTIAAAKVRGLQFHRFGLGLGVYHAGTVALEFDNEGLKCGRGSDIGWRVDVMKSWATPPTGQWFILKVKVTNPYPTAKARAKVAHLDAAQLKPVTVQCSAYDSNGRLISTLTPTDPQPNAHYDALDEAYMRTWDSGNKYQLDWFYAGPPTDSVGSNLLK